MAARLYTDAELEEFRLMPKHIINPRARWLEKPKEGPPTGSATFRCPQETARMRFASRFINGRT